VALKLGHNLLPGAGFDNPALWSLTQANNGVMTVSGSQLHGARPGAGDTAFAVANPAVPVVAGAQYELRYGGTVISGLLRFDIGGATYEFSTDGEGWVLFTPAGTGQFSIIVNVGSEILLDWVSLRRVGSEMASLVMTMRDYDGDKKQFSIPLGAVTDGATYTTVSGNATTLSAAIAAVLSGHIARQQFVATDTEPANTNATVLNSQTHLRWIIKYVDATTGDGPYQFALPTPDLEDETLVVANTTNHDATNAEWIALKAAMEGGEVKSPAGNNITITEIFLEE